MGWGFPLNFPFAELYIVTGMDVAADFTMGALVHAVEVATVGVHTFGIEFIGADIVGVVGMAWAITLTLYLLFTGALVLFFSAILGLGIFLVKELMFWEGALVHGCSCVWGWALGLGPSFPPIIGMSSSSGSRKDRDRALCSRDCTI